MEVRIGRMPGRINDFVLEEGATVRQALETAELDPTGYEIRVNGTQMPLDTVLHQDDMVLLVKQVKGN